MVVGFHTYLFRKDTTALEFQAWTQDHVEEHKCDQWCMPEDHQSSAKRSGVIDRIEERRGTVSRTVAVLVPAAFYP